MKTSSKHASRLYVTCIPTEISLGDVGSSLGRHDSLVCVEKQDCAGSSVDDISYAVTYDNYFAAQEQLANRVLQIGQQSFPLMPFVHLKDLNTQFPDNCGIFIQNLEYAMDTVSLYKEFAQFGLILTCTTKIDRNDSSKRIGTITFARKDSAQHAIKNINKGCLGSDVQASFYVSARPKSQRNKTLTPAAPSFRSSVLILGLPNYLKHWNITPALQRTYGPLVGFETCGASEPLGGDYNVCATFKHAAAARTAWKSGFLSVGRSYLPIVPYFCMDDVKRHFPHFGTIVATNLFKNVNTRKLHRLFRRFGVIVHCEALRDEQNAPRRKGFITFEHYTEAWWAISEVRRGALKSVAAALVQSCERPEIPLVRSNERTVYVRNIPAFLARKRCEILFSCIVGTALKTIDEMCGLDLKGVAIESDGINCDGDKKSPDCQHSEESKENVENAVTGVNGLKGAIDVKKVLKEKEENEEDGKDESKEDMLHVEVTKNGAKVGMRLITDSEIMYNDVKGQEMLKSGFFNFVSADEAGYAVSVLNGFDTLLVSEERNFIDLDGSDALEAQRVLMDVIVNWNDSEFAPIPKLKATLYTNAANQLGPRFANSRVDTRAHAKVTTGMGLKNSPKCPGNVGNVVAEVAKLDGKGGLRMNEDGNVSEEVLKNHN